jgi:hypothetical protein
MVQILPPQHRPYGIEVVSLIEYDNFICDADIPFA